MAVRNSSFSCLISPMINLTVIAPGTVAPALIMFSVFNGLASPITVVLNSLIIWTVMGDKRLRCNTYNLLLAALAVTDFLVGAIMQPLHSWHLTCLLDEKYCRIQCLYSIIAILGLIFNGLTVFNLMMLSVERYLAIQHPFFHGKHVTTTRVVIVESILGIFTPIILVTARIVADPAGIFRLTSYIVLLLFVIVTIYCSGKVQITAFKHRKNIIAAQSTIAKQHDKESKQNLHQPLESPQPSRIVSKKTQVIELQELNYENKNEAEQKEQILQRLVLPKGEEKHQRIEQDQREHPHGRELKGDTEIQQNTLGDPSGNEGNGEKEQRKQDYSQHYQAVQELQQVSVSHTSNVEEPERQINGIEQEQRVQDERKRRKTCREENKNTRTMFIIVFANLFFYLPLIIHAVMFASFGKDTGNTFLYLSHNFSVTFVSLQSLVNPMIVSLRMSYIRENMMKRLRSCVQYQQ